MRTMRVLLIIPAFENIYGPFRYLYKKGFLNPPLSLCYLAGSLVKSGYEVKIIDGEAEGLTFQQIISLTKEYQPSLIGMTATSVDFHNVKVLIRLLKESFLDIQISDSLYMALF